MERFLAWVRFIIFWSIAIPGVPFALAYATVVEASLPCPFLETLHLTDVSERFLQVLAFGIGLLAWGFAAYTAYILL
jgi:hypothetical protein